MKKFNLTNKIALVTGSSSGLGAAIAIAFARFGADVVVNYCSNEADAIKVVDTIKAMGRKSIAVKADVSKEGDVIKMVEKASEFGEGCIDILVNNAGNIFGSAYVKDMDASLWTRTIDVDLNSVFFVCKYVVPIMQKNGSGRIINMSSVAACNGGGLGTTPYAAAKAGIRAFSRGLAKEAAPNILVNCIAPGVIETRIHKNYVSDEQRQKNLARIPLQREGTAEEIAGTAVFLASDYASYITGEVIEVNGGLYMG